MGKTRNEKYPTPAEILEFQLLFEELYGKIKPLNMIEAPSMHTGRSSSPPLASNVNVTRLKNRVKKMDPDTTVEKRQRYEELKKKLLAFSKFDVNRQRTERNAITKFREDFLQYLQIKYATQGAGTQPGNYQSAGNEINKNTGLKIKKYKANSAVGGNTYLFEPHLTNYTKKTSLTIPKENQTQITEFSKDLIIRLMNILETIEKHRLARNQGRLTEKNRPSLNLWVANRAEMMNALTVLYGIFDETVIGKQMAKQVEEGRIDKIMMSLTEGRMEKFVGIISSKTTNINRNPMLNIVMNPINNNAISKKNRDKIINRVREHPVQRASATGTGSAATSRTSYPPLEEKYLLPQTVLKSSKQPLSHIIYSIYQQFDNSPEELNIMLPTDPDKVFAFDSGDDWNQIEKELLKFEQNNQPHKYLRLPNPMVTTDITSNVNAMNIQDEIDWLSTKSTFDLSTNQFLLLKFDADKLLSENNYVTFHDKKFIMIGNEYYLIQDIIYKTKKAGRQLINTYVVNSLRTNTDGNVVNILNVYEANPEGIIGNKAKSVVSGVKTGIHLVDRGIESMSTPLKKMSNSMTKSASERLASARQTASQSLASAKSKWNAYQQRRANERAQREATEAVRKAQREEQKRQAQIATIEGRKKSKQQISLLSNPLQQVGGAPTSNQTLQYVDFPQLTQDNLPKYPNYAPVLVLLRKVKNEDITQDDLMNMIAYNLYEKIRSHLHRLFESFYVHFAFFPDNKDKTKNNSNNSITDVNGKLIMRQDYPQSYQDTLYIDNLQRNPVFQKVDLQGTTFEIDIREYQYYFTLYHQICLYNSDPSKQRNVFMEGKNNDLTIYLMSINLKRLDVKSIKYVNGSPGRPHYYSYYDFDGNVIGKSIQISPEEYTRISVLV